MGPEYFLMSGMWIFPFMGITVMIVILSFIFGTPRNNNLQILKQRYAKGEITKEEFEDIKKDIQ